tara:strand:- start:102 stop:362 length:261 start_codon:yes stop_codon:yes gene_type:complete
MIYYKDRPLSGRMASALADGRFMFISVLFLALGCISAAVIAPTIHEALDRRQCLNHDWSPERHAKHMQYCQTNGYPTNKNYSTFSN